jgi:hypothetical protein
MAHDPIRNRIVVIDGTRSAHYDLDTNTVTTFTGPAGNASFFWCGDLNVFLYKAFGSSTVEQIDPVTFVKTTYSVSGTGPAIVGDANDQIFGRMGWNEALGIVYCVVLPSTHLFAFRTR